MARGSDSAIWHGARLEVQVTLGHRAAGGKREISDLDG
jgi:hypothetical protein